MEKLFRQKYGFVLMKSIDFINWKHSNFIFDEAFEELKEIGCAWAPQSIYDLEKGKMMIYFTMRIGHSLTKMYYAYTDENFTKLTSLPEPLFNYHNEKVQVLDADITKMSDGRYCMMYVAQQNPVGIKMAFSDYINRGDMNTTLNGLIKSQELVKPLIFGSSMGVINGFLCMMFLV